MTKKTKQLFLKLALLVLLLVGLAFLRQYLQVREDDSQAQSGVPYAEMVADDHPLLQEFSRRYPQRKILLACSEDITDDGLTDLVVISQLNQEITSIALIHSPDGNHWETVPIPAPRENQHIRFFNMDKVAEIETLITGEKDGQVGYAIYRIMDGQMINLFGEGMEDCC